MDDVQHRYTANYRPVRELLVIVIQFLYEGKTYYIHFCYEAFALIW